MLAMVRLQGIADTAKNCYKRVVTCESRHVAALRAKQCVRPIFEVLATLQAILIPYMLFMTPAVALEAEQAAGQHYLLLAGRLEVVAVASFPAVGDVLAGPMAQAPAAVLVAMGSVKLEQGQAVAQVQAEARVEVPCFWMVEACVHHL
jgi:hypothetical protein